MRGLLIRTPHIDRILSGEKTWEIRGSRTRVRGRIALIRTGSGLVEGTAELVDCRGPLSPSTLRRHQSRHLIPLDRIAHIRYPTPYAWILRNAKKYTKPQPYTHPSGAVIWIRLPSR